MIEANNEITLQRLDQVQAKSRQMAKAIGVAVESKRRMVLIGTPPTAEQEGAALVALATYLAPIQEAVASLAEAVNATDPIQ